MKNEPSNHESSVRLTRKQRSAKRQNEILSQLICEADVGHREAQRILSRIFSIDDQINYLKTSPKNCPGEKHLGRFIDQQLRQALLKEKRILLSLGKKLGKTKSYLRFLKISKETR